MLLDGSTHLERDSPRLLPPEEPLTACRVVMRDSGPHNSAPFGGRRLRWLSTAVVFSSLLSAAAAQIILGECVSPEAFPVHPRTCGTLRVCVCVCVCGELFARCPVYKQCSSSQLPVARGPGRAAGKGEFYSKEFYSK